MARECIVNALWLRVELRGRRHLRAHGGWLSRRTHSSRLLSGGQFVPFVDAQ
jgi:hypothetical protein